MMPELRQAIVSSVNSHQGIKGVELVLHVMGLVNPLMFKDYERDLEYLVAEGEIVEVEYILPQMDYRIKSMYFPKGTTVNSNTASR